MCLRSRRSQACSEDTTGLMHKALLRLLDSKVADVFPPCIALTEVCFYVIVCVMCILKEIFQRKFNPWSNTE